MARTELTKTELPGRYVDDPVDLNFQAMDAVNGNSFASTGKEILIFRNDDVGSQTATVISTEDAYGREEDQPIAMDADDIKLAGPYPVEGWRQSDRQIYLDTTSANVKVAVIEQKL